MRTLHQRDNLFTGAWLAMACLAAALFPVSAVAGESVGRGYPIPPAAAPATSSASSVSPGETPPAARPRTIEEFEAQPMHFGSANRRQARQAGEYQMPSIWPALFGVISVCAVFGLALYGMKKYLPGHRQLFTHPAMEVLGRTHLDPKRYVTLLRVGKRIIVVGVTQDEMRPLSEIVDEEEITGIMEVARPKSEMGLNIFQRLFQRHVLHQDAEEARAEADSKAEEIGKQMSALRSRVRAIRETEEPAQHVDAVG